MNTLSGLDFEVSVGLCPGQGGYRRGAVEAVARAHPRAAEVIALVDETAGELLGRSLRATLTQRADLDDEELFAAEPELVQLAAFATSVGVFEVLRSGGASVSMLIGHSLGEISALVCSGALTVAEGSRIMAHRLLVLREHDSSGGGMLTLACEPERVERILELLPTAGVVLAVDNGPRQTAVSGPADALRRVELIAGAIGVAAVRLKAGHPFHHPLLQAARDALADRIRGHGSHGFDVPVFSPILGRYYRSHDDLGELLASHLTRPVLFGQALRRAEAAGARVWIELGAGRALTNLVRTVRPEDTRLVPLSGSGSALADAVAFLADTGIVGNTKVRANPTPSINAVEPAVEPAVGSAVSSAVELPAPAAAAAPPNPLEPADRPALARSEIEARIRTLYATALEYPEEVFEPGAELEADLGVDSVKQVELMTRLSDEFALGPRPEGLRMADYRIFGRLVDFVSDALADSQHAR